MQEPLTGGVSMTRRGCASLLVGSLLFLMIASLILMGPQSCEWMLPDESFKDKDVDFLISKLKSWRVRNRDRAIWNLKDKTQERDKVIAVLMDTLLNDTHEEIRVSAAQVLARITPPATEAVPALRKASLLPEKDRGKPIHWSDQLDIPQLPGAAENALNSIIGAQKALESIKESDPPPIESSVADGDSGVDAEFINKHGIILRFPPTNTHGLSTHGHCEILAPDQRTMWRQSFTTMATDIVVTLKPRPDDPKLINGTVYVLEVYGRYVSTPYLITKITFTTKP